MNYPINDPNFRVEVLSKTERPNLLSYLAMHQDYSEGNVADKIERLGQLSETELGERLVKRCIKFNHWGVIEHPSITFNCIGFPHSVMVQARTHRVGITFDVQSMRYTGERINALAHQLRFNAKGNLLEQKCIEAIEKLFYLRPLGTYHDRNGNNYEYTKEDKDIDINTVIKSILDYDDRIEKGWSPEHARDLLIQNIRQDFVVTFNARSLLHFCDLRIPKDSQLEIRTMAEMLFENLKHWMPKVAQWYEKNRKGKNRLSP
jgi:thymidylate synthase (FAD)